MDKMEKLKQMMASKKGKMSENEVSAKKNVLGELSSMAKDAMGSKLKGLKKVTVASDSPEGLKKGLGLAEKLTGAKDESPEHEGAESAEMEQGEQEEKSEMVAEMCAECSVEELEQVKAKIEELIAAKSGEQAESKSIFPA